MALCRDHKKILLGRCIWCGKELCGKCIAREDRSKLYCALCDRRMKILPMEKFQLEEVKRPAKAKELKLPKQGYFDFSILKKK